MRSSVLVVHDLVAAIAPADQLEADHRADTLRWLESTDDIFRRAKPAVPQRHLAAYGVLTDPDDAGCLLVEHVAAGLWLPPGGHVDPDEHPQVAAGREIREELGVDPVFADPPGRPFFLTVTRVSDDRAGVAGTHVDVSLWFRLVGNRAMALTPDEREFTSTRWWTPDQVRAEDPGRFDPHFGRFLTKSAVQPVAAASILSPWTLL